VPCAGVFKLRYGFALNVDRLSRADSHNHILFLRPAISMKDPGTYDFLKQKLVAYRGRRLSPLDIAGLVRHSDLLFDVINFKFGLSYSTSYVSGLVFAESFAGSQQRQLLTVYGRRGSIAVNIEAGTANVHLSRGLGQTVKRAIYAADRGWQCCRSAAAGLWNRVRRDQQHRPGVQALIHKFYDSIGDQAGVLISTAETLAVVEPIDEIRAQLKTPLLELDSVLWKQYPYSVGKVSARRNSNQIITGSKGVRSPRASGPV
jgi:hypothetical protein